MGQLKALSWKLDAATRAAVMKSLYKLSHNMHAHKAAEHDSHVRGASADRIVANLLFNNVQ